MGDFDVSSILPAEDIEDHLAALAGDDFPAYSLAYCTVRIDEAAPVLLAILDRAADGDIASNEEATLVFRGLHVLGGARVEAAFKPLLKLLRRPIGELDDILGDAITETLPKIVAGVFDGDADALFAAIENNETDEYVRDALLGAAAFLTSIGRIERSTMERFLARMFEAHTAIPGDQVWAAWQDSIALLGFRDLEPLIERAWRDGRVPDGLVDPEYVRKTLAEAEAEPGGGRRFQEAHLGYIEDVVASLEWTGGSATALDVQQPVRNPWRNVGRNDPCPCGSGRKAKKCCLSA